MKVQVNDEIRDATEEELNSLMAGQADALADEIEKQKRLAAIKSSFDKFVALGLTELEASAITGYQPTK